MNYLLNRCAVTVVAALLALAVPAQRPSLTAYDHYTASVSGVDYSGKARCYMTEAGDPTPGLIVFELRAPDEGAWLRVNLPLTGVGCVEHVDGLRFLVTGVSSGVGRMLVVDYTPGSATPFTIASQQDYLGWDPVEARYSPFDGRLFLWDVAGSQLLVGPWTPASGTLPTLGQFTVVLPAAGATLFSAEDYWVKIHIEDQESGAIVGVTPTISAKSLKVSLQQSVWVFADADIVPAPVTAWYVRGSAAGDDPSSHSMQVLVKGSVPDSYLIKNVDTGAIVDAGTINVANTWVTITPPAVFGASPGGRYQVEGVLPGNDASSIFMPLLRYGAPLASASIPSGTGLINSFECYVNNPEFDVTAAFSGPPAPSQGNTFDVTLAINFRNVFNGSDPVSPHPTVPGVWLLDPSLIVTYQHQQADEFGRATGEVIPIPDLPFLEGLVILFQYYYSDPNGVETGVSDVFGATIRANPNPAPAAAMAPAAGMMLQPASVMQLSAICSWCEMPMFKITPAKATAFGQVQSRVGQ